MAQAIAYYRVSTDKQGIRGLGMDAQRQCVESFCKANSLTIIGEYQEVESGKRSDRPELLEAITACKRKKAKLIIAKLDRLSRSVAFISGLMESKVDFVCADMPWATPLMLHIHAAFGEHERKEIGKRTSAAIQAKIAKGAKWGVTGQAMADRNREVSMAHARMVAPIFLQLDQEGYTTIRELVAELNARDVPGPNDNKWNVASVSRYKQNKGFGAGECSECGRIDYQ